MTDALLMHFAVCRCPASEEQTGFYSPWSYTRMGRSKLIVGYDCFVGQIGLDLLWHNRM
jgi:hypothetical protein